MAKLFTGIVSSDKADKTIVVKVTTRKTHPIYKKQFSVSNKFMAHDENNEAKIGDTVVVAESRPISARKHFVLVKVVNKAIIRHQDVEEVITAPEKVVIEKPAKQQPKVNSDDTPEDKS